MIQKQRGLRAFPNTGSLVVKLEIEHWSEDNAGQLDAGGTGDDAGDLGLEHWSEDDAADFLTMTSSQKINNSEP